MSALHDVRRNASYYAREVAVARKRLADALERHRYQREDLEQCLAAAAGKAQDYQLIVDAAESALASGKDEP